MKKIILVTGATGAQGGSVAKALLDKNQFSVRILTRNPKSKKALALQLAGAEVVQGDLNDVESLKRSMNGCYGVFGVTDFWEHYEDEYRLGKNLVDAVSLSNIKHFVFSSLANYGQLSKGVLPVQSYDMKAELQSYAKSLNLPATFVQASFYYENLFGFFPLQKDEAGDYFFGSPQGDTKLATISVEDYGGIVATVFEYPNEYIGRTFRAVGTDSTCAEYASILSDVLQQKVYYKYIPREEFAALGFPGAKEFANMFEVQRLYIPNRLVDMIESYGLNSNMHSFKNWAIKNKSKIEATLAVKEELIF